MGGLPYQHLCPGAVVSKWSKLADSAEALAKRFDGIAARLDGPHEDKDRVAFGYMEGWEAGKGGSTSAHNPHKPEHPAHPEWNKGNAAWHAQKEKK